MFGLGIALMVRGDLGLPPWDVFHQGIEQHTSLTMGQVTIVVGAAIMLLWIPLRETPGVGTVLNVVVIGSSVDLFLWCIPEIGPMWQRVAAMLIGAWLFGPGSGWYIGAGLGPGPRDGLMTGLARRGVPVAVARGGIEITVLVIGWLLGGTVGVGTIVFTATIGPNVAWFLRRWSLPAIEIRRTGGRPDGEADLPAVG